MINVFKAHVVLMMKRFIIETKYFSDDNDDLVLFRVEIRFLNMNLITL